ncbi:MAG: adenylyltransferase/cytidyltransferase family protein [bacterium]|nr:adenylyltransferase/cytidyltransferase family protein [bacterium]
MAKRKYKRAVVFGIFDGVHNGHRSLFAQVKKIAEELIVIVGRDKASLEWKGKLPRHAEDERKMLVEAESLVDRAVLGDEEQSSYQVLQELSPDIICLGYDQQQLKQDLLLWMEKNKQIPITVLRGYKPSILHNSLLNSSLK